MGSVTLETVRLTRVDNTQDGKKSIHGWCAMCVMEGRKNRSWSEELRGCSQHNRNYQTTLGTFLKFVKERGLPLVEDIEIDGALFAYSNDWFVQGVQHHHGSQLLAAVMDRWPSNGRVGPENFQGSIDV